MNSYIHIPFCKSKCKYCSFVSYPLIELKKDYLKALKSEISSRYAKETLKTLYFGGGTPSLLTAKEFSSLINLFNTDNSTEITTELNPETITANYMKELRNLGINRLSFGCQTFNDKILRLIGRRHTANDVLNSVNYAKQAGFENISLDFIYGLPDQTVEMFENDLERAISLEIQHISLYGLKIDENCYFGKNPPENLPDEDNQADMYLKAIEILTRNGFEHYEISNFSKKGYNSRHNLNYWENGSYYGFGAGAHGYENGIRYYNNTDLKKYIENPLKPEHARTLSRQEQLEEEIFLGFRKNSGIDIEKINQKFDIDFNAKYSKILEKYKEYFVKTGAGYRLSVDGILISNVILAEFLD